MSEFEAASLLLAKWSLAVSALNITGIVLAFIVLRRDIRKDRASRAVRLRDKGREAWLGYLNLCLDHTDLDVFDIPIDKPIGKDPEVGRKEQIIIAQWFVMISQTFANTRQTDDASPSMSSYMDSPEWHAWIRRFTTRANYRLMWEEVKGGYDREFVTWMDRNFFSQ